MVPANFAFGESPNPPTGSLPIWPSPSVWLTEEEIGTAFGDGGKNRRLFSGQVKSPRLTFLLGDRSFSALIVDGRLDMLC